jgi:hypothetical protein
VFARVTSVGVFVQVAMIPFSADFRVAASVPINNQI